MFTVLQRDSLEWLSEQPDESINNVLTGLPDMEELNMTDINIYLEFFRKTAGLIFRKVKKNGYCIFIKTDRKFDGGIIDKIYNLTNVSINDNEYDIIDPFVGKGTTGISALTFKLKFLGIDIDGKQCEETRKNLGTFSEKINLEVIKD